jgi:hypothetical protein
LVLSQGNPDAGCYEREAGKLLGYFKTHGFEGRSYVAVMPFDPAKAQASLDGHYEAVRRLLASY